MHEVFGEPRVADHGARGVVHLRSRHGAVRPPALLQEADGGVARGLHRLPHPTHVHVGRPAREPHPRLVGEHRALPRSGPQIEQHDVTLREAPVGSGMRLVVGHRAGRPERHDGPVVGPEPRALHRVAHALLDARLPHLGSTRRLAPHPRQGLARDGRQDLGRLAMARQLRRRPPRREAGHERRGRHQARPEGFEQLNHAVRHPIEVGNLVPRRDLDREGAAADQCLEVSMELAPGAVGPHFAGKIG